MSHAATQEVEAYAARCGYDFHNEWENLPISGLFFRSRAHVMFRDVLDARGETPPFISARVQARGRLRQQVTVVVLPLHRPVPNMILQGKQQSIFSKLGIAMNESQKLALEGDFNSYFTLYCPNGYERDALYVFTPDVMAKMIDAYGVTDIEFVDDRLLLYAPLDAFYSSGKIGQVKALAAFLAEKIDRQTRLYVDETVQEPETRDPFREGQLTTSASLGHAVATKGRRARTGTTMRQKVGIGFAVTAAVAAATYWVSMVIASFSMGGG